MTTALVLIDLQNDYFPGGAMELVGADAAVAQARVLLDAFRMRSLPVFHVQHIAKQPGATFFLPDTPGVDIHAAVVPVACEAVVTKHFPSSFRETALLEHLRDAGASKLVIAGMMTHMCVDTTVRVAAAGLRMPAGRGWLRDERPGVRWQTGRCAGSPVGVPCRAEQRVREGSAGASDRRRAVKHRLELKVIDQPDER
jgi:nicotinamidase-related amidase